MSLVLFLIPLFFVWLLILAIAEKNKKGIIKFGILSVVSIVSELFVIVYLNNLVNALK